MGNADEFIDTMIKTEKEEIQEYPLEINNGVDEYSETCLICGQVFKDELDMINHQFLHTNDDFTYDEVFENDSFKFEIKYLDENPPSPNVNMKVKAPEPPPLYIPPPATIKCNRCPRIFTKTEDLLEHSVVHYHKCKKCGDKFPELKDLQEHMTKNHKSLNPATTCKCNQCNEIFTSVQELLVHSLTHSKLKIINRERSKTDTKCNECGREFQKPSQLRNHMFTHMPESERPHKCEVCQKSFATTSILKKHKLIHLPPAHQCLECGKFFSRPTHLRDHSFIHKPESEKPYACESLECKKRFGTATELKSHSFVHKSPEERPHKCHLCDRCYTKASSLREHITKHHENGENGLLPPLTKIEKMEVNVDGQKIMVPAKTIISPPPMKVPPLRIQVKSLDYMKFLMDTPNPIIPEKNPRRYQCPTCDKAFTRSDHLKRHVMTHIPADKRPFKCSRCNRCFNLVEELKAHSFEHPPDPTRPHSCHICGKAFVSKSHLNQHMVYHKTPEDRPFKCEDVECDKSFVTPGDLKRHSMSHIGKPEPISVSKYQCSECKIQFTTQALLDNHKQIHDPLAEGKNYQCQLCEKVFGKAQNLRKHQLVHSNDYPFECQDCKKKFKEKKSLTRHRLIHSDIREYKCSLCPREFHRKDYLKNHMLSHKKTQNSSQTNSN